MPTTRLKATKPGNEQQVGRASHLGVAGVPVREYTAMSSEAAVSGETAVASRAMVTDEAAVTGGTAVVGATAEADAVIEAFERRTAPARDLAEHAGDIAAAAFGMAARFHHGGKLLAFGIGPASTDAQHVAVEFVHPVIVGKR